MTLLAKVAVDKMNKLKVKIDVFDRRLELYEATRSLLAQIVREGKIDFENALSIAFMRLLADTQEPVYLEDEGRLIGRLALPESLHQKMAKKIQKF